MKKTHLAFCASLPFLLSACALNAPPEKVSVAPPSQWYAPLPKTSVPDANAAGLPHHGTLTDLSQWWQQHNDPLLLDLIQSAQAVSPTVASAMSRIEQSRATSVSAGAALLPKLDATVSATRTNTQAPLPLGTTTQAALQPSWEADLFGGNRATSRAAQARLQGAQANWHDARVSVAAEVANRYYSLRTCNKLVIVTRGDADSRAETSRLSDLSAKAGFQAPATAALARASAAEGNGRATQQRALCELDIKALVALTAIDEPTIRNRIAQSEMQAAPAAMISITSLPAQTLSQRPDVFIAEREVAAASAEVGNAQAQRYPRLSLSGSIGVARFQTAGVSTDLQTWSIGPISLSLPIFDGGKRAADVDAAQARYEAAVVSYRASVRQAVREVEEALVNLGSTAERSEDARVAVEGYRASFNGTESLYKNGLANLVDLEESRRVRLAAELNAASLERERMAAWIALYRAAGGGWSNPDSAPAIAAQP
ncbi:efflux transporter outer membrane subunit [Herminiimonas sp.]|uniref:efflux transporter outer membrane subunit n=1 Tax=Herminiimonas sp. TaxID=1926289 RepID=UPI002717B650|nr:efflux transporter outer membrane subunit [Herminiimonas sp.]MDO8304696.1 efflux transporter outer membrane subunit [Herminiimonas sp.]